ncbi:hypothetical protein [Zhongshania borealis]|uniref:Uncharacterized protein n=1 Tax=Zhongshania borealis TaxID=889488 RepID=A0ABP7X7Z5_9GAMM
MPSFLLHIKALILKGYYKVGRQNSAEFAVFDNRFAGFAGALCHILVRIVEGVVATVLRQNNAKKSFWIY